MAPTSTVSVLVAFALLCAAAGPVRAQSGIDVEDLPANAAEPARTASGTPPAAAQSAAAPEEQAAMRAYAGGDLAKALDLYRALADRQDDPKERARLLLTAAWLSWQLQDPKTSRQTLETALYADPEVAFRQDLYTPEFHELYQDAFREAVEKRRLRASQAINEAAGSMRLGDNVRARTLLAESLALRPDDPDGVYNLALLELREHHDDAALAGFERVLALERGHPDEVTPALKTQALNNAAVIYFARGDYQDAEGALAEAVKLDPGDAKSWFNLALARQKLGEGDAGFEALRHARALDPKDPDVARALAVAEIARRQFAPAAAILGEETRARPDDAGLQLLLGRAERGAGDPARAAAAFRRALELDPQNAAAALELAATLRTQGDLGGWTSAAESAVRLAPTDASGWLLLGLARQQAHDLGGAHQALVHANGLAPQRADVLHDLGAVALEQQAYEEAEADFRAALRLDPGNSQTAAALNDLIVRKQRAAAALAPGKTRDLGANFVAATDPKQGLRGLRVVGVVPGSPAADAGLRLGDLLLRADGQPIGDARAFEKLLRKRRTGVLVDLQRDGDPVQTMLSVK